MNGLIAITKAFRTARLSRATSIAALTAGLIFTGASAFGQSTFGSILGTVHDASGAVIAGCTVTVENQGTSARRSSTSDSKGGYAVENLEPGMYTVSMQAPGFQVATYSVQLEARQTIRIDGDMSVAAQTQSVSVTGEAAPVINTDVSNIAETKTGRELVDLPVAIATRSSGSTSPMSTLTTQPGVQTDSSGNISVAGTKPAMTQISIDGISSMGPRSDGPLTELFPSFNSIAEIHVSELDNSAEYGGISDITTISKSGTNAYHGGAFENIQNTALDARNPFNAVKPVIKMNDFGGYVGGPIWHDHTFFFASYEGLRLPKQTTLVESVPSMAMRSGDLSVYSTPIYMPGTRTPYANNQIPLSQISPVSLNVLQYLFPTPNTGAPNAIANNYSDNLPTPISSDQGDLRLDQVISSKQTMFFRGTFKVRAVDVAPSPGGSPTPTGSALLGAFSLPERDFGFTAAHNYVITPNIVNEARVGYNGNHTSTSFGAVPTQIATELGLTGLLSNAPPGNAVPNFNIAGFQQTGGTASSVTRNGTFQIIDNLSWTKGQHSFKFGVDYRYLTGYSGGVYSNYRLGQYNFNGAVTGGLGAANAYIGNPFGAFLLGIPDKTYLDSVVQPNLEGYDPAYAFYAQDDWKVSSRLTINYGMRYELHPKFYDHLNNISNFLPNYQSIVNGQSVLGAVVIPNGSENILSPLFAASIGPTPILTASQAGLPQNLHNTDTNDWAPRVGFAWRATKDGKTVIRAGYGKFIEVPLGSLLGAGYAIHSANQGFYNQSIVNGQPALTFPYPFPSNLAVEGSQFFQQASDINYKEAYVQEWNFTIERDLGFNTGLQLSYEGNHGSDMGVQVNLGELPPNTIGYTAASQFLKYPYFGEVESEVNGGIQNYQSFTAEVNKRFSGGLQFLGSYTFAKNLTDAQGYNPSGFATEAGGAATYVNDLMLDYGNVAYTRRDRFLATFLYQLPFGRNGLLFKTTNGVVDRFVGGWELAGFLLFQSGPFLTVTVPGADPSGTGFPQITGNGRADIVSGVPLYPTTQTVHEWLNPAAFAIPPNNIGRFPDSPVGVATGPGTQSVSMSLMKSIPIRESMRFQIGAQAANLFNHANYAPPNTTLNTAAFGTISNVQSAEGAGPRVIQGTARFIF
ncbi:MAG TPA: TonB-dependent receptor [Bryobacteraceae bacterium]|nr:TonB-dependent receptor [Bryobacteraceae bacterium]